jgi:hypothetical protein
MLYPFGVLFAWLFLENLFGMHGQGYRSRGDFLILWLVAGLASALLVLLLYSPILIYGGMKFFQISQPNPASELGNLILANLKGMCYEWTGGFPALGSAILMAGILLSLVFHGRLSTLRVPLQVATVVWVGLILLVQRPNAWSRIWFSLAALFMIWAAAGLAGLIKDFHLRRLGNISAATIVILVVFAGTFLVGTRQLATLPQAWAHKGREELAVRFLRENIGEQDIIVAPTPQDARLWYYSRLYGMPEKYYYPTTEFNRAFIVTVPVLGQYLDAVIVDYGLMNAVDLNSVKLLKEINGMNIYEVMHK